MKPTKAGFYWVRDENHGGDPMVVEVSEYTKEDETKGLEVYVCGNEQSFGVNQFTGYIFIQPPKPGHACDCDGEDTWLDTPVNCNCECQEEDDDDVDWEDGATCGCLVCLCMNETTSGEVCGDCLIGAHQG